jgi:hypothetical protein
MSSAQHGPVRILWVITHIYGAAAQASSRAFGRKLVAEWVPIETGISFALHIVPVSNQKHVALSKDVRVLSDLDVLYRTVERQPGRSGTPLESGDAYQREDPKRRLEDA